MNSTATTTGAATEQVRRTLYLSHFTPSMMAPETLEAMLVQREPVLSRTLDHVLDSLRTGGRHHTLFVGPRGIGKTHLISLLHHRLSKTPEASEHALVAWMREEEWGVTSFFELVLRILRTLDATYPALALESRVQPIYELPLAKAEKEAESLLLDIIKDKCLVIFLENLDDLFQQIGDQGQKAWRAFIQNHGNMLLVCTTPALFSGVSLQKSAFYGFFDIEVLAELEFEDVVALLQKIASERGDAELAAFIETPEGRARIRAVHHLAEGNPRIYIIFAQFLTRDALDELVAAFMHTLDELTPYYQARMKELSAQQRKIVEYLLHYRGAAPVKQIAKACFISQQTCSSQLKQLKEKRYVRSIEQGRESFYELCEPLMRLCMEVKLQRGEPISLFVEMLRIWYTEFELENWLKDSSSLRSFDARYLQQALARTRTPDSDPKTKAIRKDLMRAIENGRFPEALVLLNDLEALGSKSPDEWSIFALSLCLSRSDLYLLKDERLAAKVAAQISQVVSIVRVQKTEAFELAAAYFMWAGRLYSVCPENGEKTLPSIVSKLAPYPAQTLAGVLLVTKAQGIEPESQDAWLMRFLEAYLALERPLKSWQRVSDMFVRMITAFADRASNTKSLAYLELSSEERKLIDEVLSPN